MVIVRIRDLVAEIYHSPFPAESIGSAVRAFEEACKDPNTPYGKYPKDFILYQVGEFRAEDPEITAVAPLKLCEGQAPQPINNTDIKGPI